MSPKIELDVDTTIGHRKLDVLEHRRNEVILMSDKVFRDIDTGTRLSAQKVLLAARQGYGILTSLITAAGGTVSTLFTASISAAFSVVAILTPLFTAEAVTPGMQVQAALGFLQLGLSIAAIVNAQSQQSAITNQIQGGLNALNGTANLVGTMSFM